MENIFEELEKIGITAPINISLYEKKEPVMVDNKPKVEKTEKDFIFEKKYQCPICQNEFKSKVLKSKSARLLGHDFDYKPNYHKIEILKYNAIMCPKCGYANIINEFNNITSKQRQLYKENIKDYISYPYNDEVCGQEEALIKFKMALITATFIKSSYSKKAFICLHLAWLYRSFASNIEDKIINYKYLQNEKFFYKKAFEGYTYAIELESPPLSIWKEDKFYYIYACLAYKNNEPNIALKIISDIVLAKSTSNVLKEEARNLRDLIKEKG